MTKKRGTALLAALAASGALAATVEVSSPGEYSATGSVAATGLLKGSFAVFTQNGERLKKTKAAFNGVLVGGAGYGSAVVKKYGSAGLSLVRQE